MKKIVILISLLFLYSRPVEAATITPAIGDLKIGESKDVVVSGLTANTAYVWSELSKQGQKYEEYYKECNTTDSSGKKTNTVGPLNRAGVYKLEIYLRKNFRTCQVNFLDTPVFSHDFSVGGATGTSCCVAPFGGYDPAKDECARIVGRGQLSPTTRRSTECSKIGTFCDAGSFQCFQTNPSPTYTVPGFPQTGKGSGAGGKCTSGFTDALGNPVPAIDTAIGCVPTEPVAFIKAFLRFTLAIGGGVAFLIMVMGVFQMITSAGNADSLKGGQEMFTSAIIGILFIIFSVLLLQIIGVGILNIPGFI